MDAAGPEIDVTPWNIGTIHEQQQHKQHFLNGLFCSPGPHAPAKEGDLIRFVEEQSIVDRIGELAELAMPDDRPAEEYLVVQCFNPAHTRRNDLLASDPNCAWCHGLGLVRVRKDHVPIVRRADKDKWAPATNIVEQIGDLAS